MTELLKTESLRYALSRAKYLSRDFYSFLDDQVARLNEQFGDTFNDIVQSDLGVMLIELTAWTADSLAFAQDRYASEAFLETAWVRRAVNRIARALGYKMGAATAASTDLLVNLSEVHAFDCTIPVGFQFPSDSGLIFECSQAVTFPAGEGPLSVARSVPIREGYTVVQNFRSDGSKNQKFRLSPGDDRYVAKDTMVLTVGGASWAEQEFLPYEQADYFEVDYNADPPLLRFGDGRAGNVPALGDDIRAEYLSIAGPAGNLAAGSIESSSIDLVVAFTTIGLTITQPTRTSGGDERETLEKAKATIPNFFAARDVAVTSGDYLGLARAFRDPVSGAVAVAHAFVALGADDDITLQTLIALIRSEVALISGEVLASTTSLAALVVTYLANIASANTRITDQGVDIAAISGNVTAARNWLGLIPVGVGPSELIAGDYNALLAILTTMDLAAQDAEVERLGLDGLMTVDFSNNATAISAEVVAIEAAMNAGFVVVINDNLDDIYDHVDAILSSTCKANLVTVPILTLDSDGFYATPSTALVRSLQAHLDARKEVSQVISVVSGGESLVSAVISGTIGVVAGSTQATVLGKCYEAIYGILRGRSFNSDLHLSDLYREIVPKNGVGGIPGVSWATLKITGPSDHLDTEGTLVVDDSEVITRGSVTLTAEAA